MPAVMRAAVCVRVTGGVGCASSSAMASAPAGWLAAWHSGACVGTQTPTYTYPHTCC